MGFKVPDEPAFELDEKFFEDWVNAHTELVFDLRVALEVAEAYATPDNPVLANHAIQVKVLLASSAASRLGQVLVNTKWRSAVRAANQLES